MTSSSGFKEKNAFHCLAGARTNMKNTKEIVHHCYNSCEMFVQFHELLRTLLITHLLVFYLICKNNKIGLDEKCVCLGGGGGGVRSVPHHCL